MPHITSIPYNKNVGNVAIIDANNLNSGCIHWKQLSIIQYIRSLFASSC